MARIAWLALLAFTSGPGVALAEDPIVGEITLQGRDAVDVVIRAPYRDASSPEGRSATVRLIDTIDQALRARTTLFAREAKESRNLIDAKGDTIAILKAVRADVDLVRLQREGKQIEDHNRERSQAGERPARFVVVLTILPQGDKSRVSLVLVDADEGLTLLLHDEGRVSREELEQRFQEDAVAAKPPSGTVASEDDTVAYVGRVFTQELRPAWERAGVWDTPGAIELTCNVDDAELRFDGFLVGTTRRGVMLLKDAPLGPHTVGVVAAGYTPFEVPVQVAAGRTERVDATLEASAGPSAMVRSAALWGGVGAGVAGVAFLAWAGALTGDGTSYTCLAACSGVSWVRAGRVLTVSADDRGPLSDELVTGSGPALAPLGYSLLLTSAVWTLGPQLFETDDGIPWISILAGLGVGALSYGLSEALETPQVTTPP